MKTQIRNKVWETNSSAVNSLCWSPKGAERNHLTVHEDGYVHVILDRFYDTDYHQFFTQKEKLKYIVTWIYHYYNFNVKEKDEWYLWNLFILEFCKYVNTHPSKRNNNIECQGISVSLKLGEDSYDYLNHQLIDSYIHDGGNCVVNLWNPEECVSFIFNKYIGVETNSD